MSSHHFVIDGQEPALIIANGARCKQDLMNQLLEWCPFVLVLDGALQDVLDKGIAFNAVSGDFDSEPNAKDKTAHLHHIEIIPTPDQDYTDLQKGVEICLARGYKDVHILWGTGKRSDHILGNLDLITKMNDKVNLIFWDDFHKIYGIPSGFKKWFPKGLGISLLPWPVCKTVNAANLKWPLHNLDLRFAYQLSTSNEIKEEGMLEITYKEGNLIMMEEIETLG
jgi:thiamine pyrophosphokinase